ncbi:MAG: hypothetical protein ACLPKB_00375 [Xanthobacteraceae bacterium]
MAAALTARIIDGHRECGADDPRGSGCMSAGRAPNRYLPLLLRFAHFAANPAAPLEENDAAQ